MAAAGNDFIVIDNRRAILKKNLPQIAKRFCDRKRSIGGDGVLLLEKSKKADILMRIFNPDGSEADMCGNGVRCLARFAVDKKITKNTPSVETGAGIVEIQVRGSQVKAHLMDPKDFKPHVDLSVDGHKEKVHFINTGVPHAVIFDSALEKIPVNQRGHEIRAHAYFAPRGTNVNFVKVNNRHSIEVRTYERGVESETLACGTGSTASALVSASLRGLRSPVNVQTTGGEILKVYFKNENGFWKDVYLEGPVQKIFEGSIAL
jgi:diaminopimelate epimerase